VRFLGNHLLCDRETSGKEPKITATGPAIIQAVADLLEEMGAYFDFVVKGATVQVNESFNS
jgi:hypothetical protein